MNQQARALMVSGDEEKALHVLSEALIISKKIGMFYQAMSWDNPVDKRYTLEKFF